MVIERINVILTLNQLFDGDPYWDDSVVDADLINAYISSGLFEDHHGDVDPSEIVLIPERTSDAHIQPVY